MLIVPQIGFYTALLTHKPLDIISASQFAAQFNNEYYSDGFVKKATFTSAGSLNTYEFKYTSLQAGN